MPCTASRTQQEATLAEQAGLRLADAKFFADGS